MLTNEPNRYTHLTSKGILEIITCFKQTNYKLDKIIQGKRREAKHVQHASHVEVLIVQAFLKRM